MVKIEWFKLESDAAKEYLQQAIAHIKEKYPIHQSSLTDDIKKAIFCDNYGNFSEKKVENFLKHTRQDLIKNAFFRKYIRNPTLSSKCETAIKEIFNYQIVNVKRGTKNNLYTLRHNLLTSLNVDCCPYCNRQYITTYKNVSKIRYATADLDHFYPRKQYPLFALSLFNFVPSCQICNSRMKHDKTEECLYPYEESFGNYAFFTISTSDNVGKKPDEYYKNMLYAFQGRKECDFSIEIENVAINSELRQRIDSSINLFKLHEVYQAHQEYVRELLIKQRIYDEGAYLNMLKEQFGKLGLQFTESELEVFLYGFHWDDEDHHTRPLSKLTYDLIKRNPKSHI